MHLVYIFNILYMFDVLYMYDILYLYIYILWDEIWVIDYKGKSKGQD